MTDARVLQRNQLSRSEVVGDPQQLSHAVISRACSDAGFANLWIEKVQPNLVHLLDTQNRMDPEIQALRSGVVWWLSVVGLVHCCHSTAQYCSNHHIKIQDSARGRKGKDPLDSILFSYFHGCTVCAYLAQREAFLRKKMHLFDTVE